MVDFIDSSDVGLLGVLLNTFTYPQLPLELVDFLTVLSLILDVALGTACDFSFHFFVFFMHTFDSFLQGEVFV